MKYRLKPEAKVRLKHLLKETLIVLSYTFAILFITGMLLVMMVYPMLYKPSIIEISIAWIGYLFVLCMLMHYAVKWIINNIEPIED